MNATDPTVNGTNSTERSLSMNDFSEPLLLPHGLVAPSTILLVSCHWHESGSAYLTLYDKSAVTYADFSIRRVIDSPSSFSYHMLLGLPPREAGDLERPPLYLVRVLRSNQVIVLGQPEIESLLPLAPLTDQERCDLSVLSVVLGPVPTWEEVRQSSEQ